MALKTVPLSPVDHVFVGRDAYSVEFLLAYPYRLDGGRMKRALRRTVKTFWPVGADLVSRADGMHEFSANDRELDFEEREGGAQMPDLKNPVELADFTSPVQTLPGERIARFRLVHVGSGSIFVANISHALVDGYSYFYFLSALAAAYRYRPWNAKYWAQKAFLPDLDRRKLRPLELAAQPYRGELDADKIFQRTGFTIAGKRSLPGLSQSKWEFMRFTPDEIVPHRKANADARLSSHDVVTALLWKRAAEEWHTNDELLECSSAFDYRRVYGALSPRFWGNAVRATGTRLQRSEVLSLPVPELAARIRAATKAVNTSTVLDSLRCAEEMRLAHGTNVFQRVHVSNPRTGFLVTNLSRLPFAQLDFGKGPPLTVTPLTSVLRAGVLLGEGDDIIARFSPPN